MRAANLRYDDGDGFDRDEFAFAVDYQLCHRCEIGWVEQPYTLPAYQRRGLAAAGLAALRVENPGFTWHTLGCHIDGSSAFWDTVGVGIAGGYWRSNVREHVTARAGRDSSRRPTTGWRLPCRFDWLRRA